MIYNQNTADNKIIIAQKGGIPLILQIIKQHLTQVELLTEACWCLLNLSIGTASNRKIIIEEKGIELLIQVLQKHSNQEELQKWCSAAILIVGFSGKFILISIL